MGMLQGLSAASETPGSGSHRLGAARAQTSPRCPPCKLLPTPLRRGLSIQLAAPSDPFPAPRGRTPRSALLAAAGGKFSLPASAPLQCRAAPHSAPLSPERRSGGPIWPDHPVGPAPIPAANRPPPPPRPRPHTTARARSCACALPDPMRFPSPPAPRRFPAPQAAAAPKRLPPHLGSLDPRALLPGPRAVGAPGHPCGPGGRGERRIRGRHGPESQPPHNTWPLRFHFFHTRREEPARAMGVCEVREFLWQFGFFLPLRTAWPGYCSQVSNNQGNMDLPSGMAAPQQIHREKGNQLCCLIQPLCWVN
nr:formin-like protein 3 [Cavia porcellus]